MCGDAFYLDDPRGLSDLTVDMLRQLGILDVPSVVPHAIVNERGGTVTFSYRDAIRRACDDAVDRALDPYQLVPVGPLLVSQRQAAAIDDARRRGVPVDEYVAMLSRAWPAPSTHREPAPTDDLGEWFADLLGHGRAGDRSRRHLRAVE